MPEAAVIVSYGLTYGAILGYAAWIELRRRRGSPGA
jgi:hypothetical protein